MERSIDRAAQKMLQVAKERGLSTAWDRYESQKPQCRFGASGLCCRMCVMGPCRIVEGKAPSGACGASVDTIAARNLARMIAAGTAAHSDHGRDVAHTLAVASQNGDYKIKDALKLRRVAYSLGIEVAEKKDAELAAEVAHRALDEFGKREGELLFAHRAPERRVELWRRLGIMPRAIDREVVEVMHRTSIGVDADYRNIILQGMRCALADGWGGSMIATELQDILFGTPSPLRAKVNLGVLDPRAVNIVVHGHEPTLPEMIVVAAQDPELQRLSKKKGAAGINIAGICCTANEILMRHGIPIAGNFLHQELAVMTGVVDAMVVDIQCIMPALSDLMNHFHTVLVATSPKAKIPGAEHVEFSEDRALEAAKEIVRMAIENFPRRNGKALVPEEKMDLIAGFTAESVFYFLGGRYRATYRPLNDAIIDGRLRGVAGIVGCNNPRITQDFAHVQLAKELIKHDVLVVTTGCAAIADAKAGLLRPEAAFEFAGKGLQEICEAVGIPPVLHLGACVDNSRILIALTNMVHEGGLGDDISDIPGAGAAPEWMSEKAVAIGFYFAASGVFTVLGQPFPITASENLMRFLTEELEGLVGGKFAFEPDPIKAAHLMLDHIDRKRHALKLREPMYA